MLEYTLVLQTMKKFQQLEEESDVEEEVEEGESMGSNLRWNLQHTYLHLKLCCQGIHIMPKTSSPDFVFSNQRQSGCMHAH